MGYVVIETFADMQDGGHVYNQGEVFPRLGVTVSDARVRELSCGSNRLGKPLIEEGKKKTRKKNAD